MAGTAKKLAKAVVVVAATALAEKAIANAAANRTLQQKSRKLGKDVTARAAKAGRAVKKAAPKLARAAKRRVTGR
jgi:hypothetical protein